MSRRSLWNGLVVVVVVSIAVGAAWLAHERQGGEAGLPRMVDLGSKKCIPCKRMAPILQELMTEYDGRFEIVFIDVWKDPAAGREYGIRVIPTQIFYDPAGVEVWRHEGFLSKEDILAKLVELEG